MIPMRSFVLAVAATAFAACSGPSKPGTLPVADPVVERKPDPPAVTPPAPAPIAHAEKVRSFEGIDEYKLANGLRVLLFPDATQSTVTVNITYLVGSMHEGSGETGMAHLL